MQNTFPIEQPGPQENQEQEIHLRDYFRVVIKRKMIVVTFLIITFLTVVIGTYTATPYYTAASQVLIEKNFGPSSLDNSRVYWDPDFLTTQFELIRSINVSRRVVDKLQLDTKYKHYFFEPRQEGLFTYLSSLKRGIKDFLSGLFVSDTPIEETTIPGSDALLTVSAEPMTDADIIAAMIQANLSISPVPNTKTVYIVYSSKHPAMAKLVVNAVVQAYMDEILEIKLATSNYSLQWMTSKADEERKKLESSELALQQYMRENDLVTVENKLAVYPQKLAEFSSQLSKAQTEQKEYEAVYAQIKKSEKDYRDIETIPLFSDNKVLQDLREKIFMAEQKIKDLSKKYGYKHPTMSNAKAEHDQLLNEKKFEIDRIIEATRNAYDLAKSREANLKQLLATTKQEILDINERFMQYSIMKREVDMNRVLYDALTSSIKKAGVTEQSQDVNVWVVKKADLPMAPATPRKKRNLALGLILGIFGGVGLAFFIEYLDNTVKDGKDLERRFGLTVLGSVQEVQDKSENIETYLLKNPLSPLAESYRLIRSSLLLSTPDHPPRSILITSMGPKEGKTSTACNLARILIQNDKKVLIIDCDMRKPRIHSIFGIPNTFGLSNYLAGSRDKNLLKSVPDEAIALILSGPTPPNPAELINSNRMKLLIDEMLKMFDFVILDSPPVQSVTDSLPLNKLVDGTILVTRSGKTTYDMLESGLKKMHEMRANILGIVLNGIKKNSTEYSSYVDYYHEEKG
ncbi:MAG: polysaccharide biosynthesis tyrosine autokinase [Proteobacteria bacterium]|nr:polysaccharide biosynthesis tyrosine autokinase [Pseudomonadota bacterium]MBU1420038.1 polysaccharide biosynthesis tyrosine autokinase [Pseudomonadota bacterium]MBU1454854.1 polysaccharide biosynthesis tyrosine autokinase [Pseudomonadota bacterium]